KGLSEEELEIVLSIRSPEILFPYAREVISGLASKGGFPQLVLPPVNFEGMYFENKEKKNTKQPEASLAE
ncbi:MAG: protein-export chaperone SecB, partial [Francisellaceae bacterium]|nr:protein-export chaperone SecB [Francisellaceae bacterium]